jgi:hypothetical protein
MVHIILFSLINVMYFYISTSRSLCAVTRGAVFRSSLFRALEVCYSDILLLLLL